MLSKLNKLRDNATYILILVAVLVVLGYFSSRWLGLEEDNIIEQFGEYALKVHTGIDMDFTEPDKPQK